MGSNLIVQRARVALGKCQFHIFHGGYAFLALWTRPRYYAARALTLAVHKNSAFYPIAFDLCIER